MVTPLDPGLAGIEPNSTTIEPAAAVFVWGFHVAVPLALALVAGLRALLARRRARCADAHWVETAPLEPGEAVIHGEVELAPGRSTAVRVEIDQDGREFKGKNGWRHVWTEVSRAVKVEPFYVHDRRGATIRVEPARDTMLVDALDQVVRRGHDRRTRIAELSPGEAVYVIGTLVRGHDPDRGGYRDNSSSLVLRPPARGRMLCSAKPLGDRFRERATRERSAMRFFLGYVVVLALFDATYHARVHVGVRETGEILSAEKFYGKNSRCKLEIAMSGGATFSEDVSLRYCDILRPGSRVPIVHFGSSWFAHVGARPGVNVGIVIPSLIVLGFAIVLYLARGRPWYEAKVVDRAPGRLPKS